MGNDKFSFRKRLKSFYYAWNGLCIMLQEEHNSRIHLFAAVFTTILGFSFGLDRYEWMAVIFCMGLVFICELFNSALEALVDFVSEEKQPLLKKVKDLAAAAVLVSAMTAFIVGLLIFIPKLSTFF